MEEAISEAKSHGAVKTLTGRRRPMPDIRSKNPALRQFAERTAINSPVQGTAADLMKAAMIRCDREVRAKFPEAHLILQVHDELLFEVPAAQAEELRKLLDSCMEDPRLLSDFGIEGFDVDMKVDSGVGRTWGDL